MNQMHTIQNQRFHFEQVVVILYDIYLHIGFDVEKIIRLLILNQIKFIKSVKKQT